MHHKEGSHMICSITTNISNQNQQADILHKGKQALGTYLGMHEISEV
jgi:hypothetical protein